MMWAISAPSNRSRRITNSFDASRSSTEIIRETTPAITAGWARCIQLSSTTITALLIPEIRSTKYSLRCAFANQTGSGISQRKPCSFKYPSAAGTSPGFMKRSRSLVTRHMPVYFSSAKAPATAYGTPFSFMATRTSRYKLAASSGRTPGVADVSEELHVELACGSGMSSFDVLLFQAVAESYCPPTLGSYPIVFTQVLNATLLWKFASLSVLDLGET